MTAVVLTFAVLGARVSYLLSTLLPNWVMQSRFLLSSVAALFFLMKALVSMKWHRNLFCLLLFRQIMICLLGVMMYLVPLRPKWFSVACPIGIDVGLVGLTLII